MQEFFGSYEFPPFEVINTFEVDGSKVSVWFYKKQYILFLMSYYQSRNLPSYKTKWPFVKGLAEDYTMNKYLTFRKH